MYCWKSPSADNPRICEIGKDRQRHGLWQGLRFLDLRLPPASSVAARALSWTVILAISLQVVEPFFSFLAPFVSAVAEPPILGGRLPQIHSCIGVGHIDHLTDSGDNGAQAH
eukprot:CAMPEP_0181414756 /NCGR_PEP_ID=MMETSP1110-20121109/9667_1 /TAXON_ID=174948 /ORGANISM="Symbiodinium sp., Strain CCMP421" /LENGTH=111 /DNA_ID=CAMNT_0023537641 /DNA_START=77 /DNA_END=409 /DNA_ORIENTATION=-